MSGRRRKVLRWTLRGRCEIMYKENSLLSYNQGRAIFIDRWIKVRRCEGETLFIRVRVMILGSSGVEVGIKMSSRKAGDRLQ